jgi:hypothetical protein
MARKRLVTQPLNLKCDILVSSLCFHNYNFAPLHLGAESLEAAAQDPPRRQREPLHERIFHRRHRRGRDDRLNRTHRYGRGLSLAHNRPLV